jgi:N-acetylglutamate synthase-like GNAT family acetyltransferase
MTVQATWEITIERRDGSRYVCTEYHGREPSPQEIIETTDDAGRTIRAKINVITKHLPKVAGLGIFQITAKEIETFEYRVASRGDETDILAALEEVAPEIPVLIDTPQRQDAIKGIIVECHKSGQSFVAVDANSEVVGFVLARPDIHEQGAISLRYVGVSKNSRRHGIFATFIEKLKAKGVPLTASVLHDNRSAMADQLVKVGFTELEANAKETKFRWAPGT